MKLNKTYEVSSFKALEDEGPGVFEAVVAVEGNVDLQGDRIMLGAFKSSTTNWRRKGDPFPIIWSHQWINPEAHIGFAMPEDIEEIEMTGRSDDVVGGLKIKGTIDVHKPFAGQVFDLLKERRVKEWSFAYDVVREKRAEDGANELLELELLEAGPALKGANPETYTVSAKSAVEQDLTETLERQKIIAEVTKEVMEKVASKPWHVEERDGEFCVIKDSDGESEGCHPTREMAEAHIRALYANESSEDPDVEKAVIATSPTNVDVTYVPDSGRTTTADAAKFFVQSAMPNGKIGRVIGAKAAASLKDSLSAAVDAFVAEVNGANDPKSEESEDDELASYKAQIAALEM